MADFQNTVSLVLEAKDEASAVLEKVGQQMLTLAAEAEKLRQDVAGHGAVVNQADAIKAVVAQRLAAEKEGYRQSQAEATRAQDEMVKALGAADRGRMAAERKQAADRLQQARLDRNQQLLEHNEHLNRQRDLVIKNAEAERLGIVQQAEKRNQEAQASRDFDLQQAQEWLDKRRAVGKEADEAAVQAMRRAVDPSGAPRMSEEQIAQEMERRKKLAEDLDQIDQQHYEKLVAKAHATYAEVAKEAEVGGKQLVAASYAFEEAELKQLEKWRIEGNESIRDTFEQRVASVREILRQATEGSRIKKEQEVRDYLAKEHEKTVGLQKEHAQRLQIIRAAGEQALAEGAQKHITATQTDVERLQRELGKGMQALPKPAIKPVYDRFWRDEGMLPALENDATRIESFRSALAAAGAGAKGLANQLQAVRSAADELNTELAISYRAVTEFARNAAEEEQRAIKTGLTQQLQAIRTYQEAQIALIEGASRQIQQLLRQAYDAPGATDAMRAETQRMIREHEAATEKMVADAKSGGEKLVQQARKTAQESSRAVENGLRVELGNTQETMARMVSARKKAAEEAALTLRHAAGGAEEFGKSLTHVKEASETVLGPLGHVVEMGRQMLVWGIGYQIVMSMYTALTQMAGGLITANAQVQQIGMTFAAIYQQTPQQGEAMVRWLDEFATKVPGTRQEVREAALAFASAGDSVRDILPAASNLAAIMGVDLPRAAQAMVDAQEGRFEMLQMTLHTTKQELQEYGLVVDRTGHVTAASFVPAIERYVQMRFGEHVKMDAAAVHDLNAAFGTAHGRLSTYAQTAQNVAMVRAGMLPGEGEVDPRDPTRATRQQAALQQQIVHAFAEAEKGAGHLRELNQLFGVTADDLDKINRNWRQGGAEAEKAIEKWFKMRYGVDILHEMGDQTSAIYKQMQTLPGAFSNVQDALVGLQETLGKGLFDVLKDHILGVYYALKSPEVAAFARELGQTLGRALDVVINGFQTWYGSIGGLAGLLSMLQTVLKDVWGVLQGVGDALHLVGGALSVLLAPVTAVLDLFHILGAQSREGAGSLRFLTAAVIDLFAAFKAYQILDAVWGSLKKVHEAAVAATLAQRAQAAAAVQAAGATGTHAAAHAEDAVMTAADEAEIRALIGTLGEETEAETVAAATTSLPSGLPKGAPMAGKAAAGAAAGAEAVTLSEAAVGGVSAFGAAVAAAAPPLLLLAAGVVAVTGAVYVFQQALERSKEKQDRDRIKPFLPPTVEALPSRPEMSAGSLLAGAFGPAGGVYVPPIHEALTSPGQQFLDTLTKEGRRLAQQAEQGTGAELLEHQRLWMEYLNQHPEVLKRLNAALRAVHQPEHTRQEIERSLTSIRQAQLSVTESAIKEANTQLKQAYALFDADVKNRQSAVVTQLQALGDAQQHATLMNTGDIDKAVAESVKTMRKAAEKNWDKFDKDTQVAVASMPDILDKNWIHAHWAHLKTAVQDVLKTRGLGPGAPPGGTGDALTQDALQKQLQQYQSNLQIDVGLGARWATIHADYQKVLQTISKGIADIGLSSDQYMPMVEQATQGLMKDIPNLITAPPQQVKAYFDQLSADLQKYIPDARVRALVLKEATDAYLNGVAQQASDVFSAAITLRDTALARAQIPTIMEADKRHKVPEAVRHAHRQQLEDQASNLEVQQAETRVRYLVQQHASMGEIQAAYQRYVAAENKLHESQEQHALNQRQLWDSIMGKHAQNLELQLQYDQMTHAAWGTIKADIEGIAAGMTAAGEDFKAVAIKRHQLLVAAYQQEEQTQQQYIAYSETMGENWSVVMQHINQRASALASTDVPNWQVTLTKGHDIQQAIDVQLDNAQKSGASYAYMVGIINAGAVQLQQAGWSRVAVERWVAEELQKAGQALQQAMERNQSVFDLAAQQGRIRTEGDALRFIAQQSGLVRQEPRLPGETDAQYGARRTLDTNRIIEQGFNPLIEHANRQFQWDTGQGNSAAALKDENRILALSKDMWQREGLTPQEQRERYQALKDSLEKTRTGGYTRPPEPAYQAYGGLGRQPGFGGVEVMFGGPHANPYARMIAELQATNAHLREENKRLQDIIAALNKTATNTATIARNTQPTGYGRGHEPIYAARSSSPVGTIRKNGSSSFFFGHHF